MASQTTRVHCGESTRFATLAVCDSLPTLDLMCEDLSMVKRNPIVAGFLAAAMASIASVATAQTRAPNIVVIMTDDVGWGDLGSYGGGAMRGAPTPNLDHLAAEGMRFVNYYGQASCTAGRASFITGRIPIRTSLSSVLAPGDPNGLTKQTPTIASYLKKANYTTVQLGKWHVGDRPENFPIANGFDEMIDMLPYYAGVYAYDDLNLHPNFPVHDRKFMALWNQVDLSQWTGQAGREPTAVKKEFTYADLATGDDEMRAHAIDWLKAHAKDSDPFFMYLCFLKVHNPNNPSPRWKGKSPGGGKRQISRCSNGARRQFGPSGAGNPRSWHRREYARSLDHRQWRLDRCLA
jgi:arylsulfatase